MNLIWITDPHLPFLEENQIQDWTKNLEKSDGLLLGGDLCQAPTLKKELERLLTIYHKPIYLVTGNHDFYKGSILEVRSILKEFSQIHPRITIFEPTLKNKPILLPAANTWLCGTGGWGDAKAGTKNPNNFPINDENYIQELALAREENSLTPILQTLGEESAQHLNKQLEQIPQNTANIIILTHVPPWKESAWHLGQLSHPHALDRFCCQSTGKIIQLESEKRPNTKFLVLCGHTHSKGIFKKKNITCHTGGSSYGTIHQNALLKIENQNINLTRLDQKLT